MQHAFCIGASVVIHNQRPLLIEAIRIGKHIFVHPSVGRCEIKKRETGGTAEEMTQAHERKDFPFMPFDQPAFRYFIPIGTPVFHAVFFRKTFDLPVTEHGQPRHGDEQCGNTEIFVAFAELCFCGIFIGVVHEIDETLQNLRAELQNVFDRFPVLGVVFHLEHVHECTVIHPVHPQRPDKIALHEPEGFRQKQRVRHFCHNPVHHFPPEFHGKGCIEGGLVQTVGSPGRNGAAVTGQRKPQTLVVPFGKGHGGIEADNREATCNFENGLNNSLPRFRVKKIQLCRIVPGHAGAVVAVIDVAHLTGMSVHPFENYGGVAVIPVAVFYVKTDTSVFGKIGTVKTVSRVGWLGKGKKAVRMICYPFGIQPHVIGHHIARQADTALPCPVCKILIRLFATQISCNYIVMKAVCRCRRFGVAHALLDNPGCRCPLPYADEP